MGSIGASGAWFLIVALSIYSPSIFLPLVMWSAFAVTIRSVWRKAPPLPWRFFAVASLHVGLIGAWMLGPIKVGPDEAMIVTPLLVWTTCVGFALLPLGLVSLVHTLRSRRRPANDR